MKEQTKLNDKTHPTGPRRESGVRVLHMQPTAHLVQLARERTERLTAVHLTQLQFVLGNRAVNRLVNHHASSPAQTSHHTPSLVIQPKLQVNAVGDKYEQEADAVAKEVVQKINAPQTEATPPHAQRQTEEEPIAQRIQRQEAPQEEELQLQRQEIEDEELHLQRQELEEEELQLQRQEMPEEEEMQLQRQELPEEDMESMVMTQRQPQDFTHGGPVDSQIEAQINHSRGGGQPMDDSIRQPMEQAFGADFSDVRIHTDTQAHNLNQAIQARAFTTGNDIYFKDGEYGYNPSMGQELLAHELSHVIQQTGSIRRQAGMTSAEAPMSIAAPEYFESVQEPKERDGEGNEIAQASNGRWYLIPPVITSSLPLASGFKPHLLPINPITSYKSLLERGQEICEDLLNISNKLMGDMKYWFAKVYYYVTQFELQKIEAGEYQYPHMKLQEVIEFYNTYKINLENWEAGNKQLVEENWKRAFEAAESMNDGSWLRSTSFEILKALLPSIEAHIRFDLPRAISAVFEVNYAGIPDTSINDFVADFFKMSAVFKSANIALTQEIDDEESIFRIGDPTSWNWAQDMGFPVFFDISSEREITWEKVELLQKYKNLKPDLADRYIRAFIQGIHPLRDVLEVDDEYIQQYDWFNQPNVSSDPHITDQVTQNDTFHDFGGVTPITIDVRHKVFHVTQKSQTDCWIAALSMMSGVITPVQTEEIDTANDGSLKYEGLTSLARQYNLTLHHPQSWSVESLHQLLIAGPILVIGKLTFDKYGNPAGHAIVVSGIIGDGTPDGTELRIHDPNESTPYSEPYTAWIGALPNATEYILH